MDDGDFDALESGIAEKPAYFSLCEAEPNVGVHIAGFLIIVAQQVQNHDSAARLQNPVGLADGLLRVLSVMQRLAEERQIATAGPDGNLFNIALAIFEIIDSMFAGKLGP